MSMTWEEIFEMQMQPPADEAQEAPMSDEEYCAFLDVYRNWEGSVSGAWVETYQDWGYKDPKSMADLLAEEGVYVPQWLIDQINR